MNCLPEMELLQYLYKTADMGCERIDAVEKHAEQKLLGELKRQRSEYENVRSDAAQMIRNSGEEPGGNGLMARLSTGMMTACQMARDDSRSKIAEMMIRGNTSGVIKGLKNLHQMEQQDDSVSALSLKLLDTESANVDQMKQFL